MNDKLENDGHSSGNQRGQHAKHGHQVEGRKLRVRAPHIESETRDGAHRQHRQRPEVHTPLKGSDVPAQRKTTTSKGKNALSYFHTTARRICRKISPPR